MFKLKQKTPALRMQASMEEYFVKSILYSFIDGVHKQCQRTTTELKLAPFSFQNLQ